MLYRTCRSFFLLAAAWICFDAELPAQYLYVANSGADNISGYRVNTATGALTAIPGSPFAVAGSPWSVAVHPSNQFVYATGFFDNTGINGYALDLATGALSPLPESPFSAAGGNIIFAIQPSGKFAYVTNGGGSSVSVYAINSQTGALTFAEKSSVTPVSRRNMLIHPSGKFVYLTQDCVLNGIFCTANTSSFVYGYVADSITGALTPIPGSPFSAGIGPQSLASDPTGRFLYAANAGGDISGFLVDPSSGALAPMAGSPFGQASTSPLALAISPDGKFIYVPRGDGNVWAYSIDPTFGALSLISTTPLPSGQISLALAVECTGKFLYVANWYSGNVTGYSISASTGVLSAVPGSPFVGGNSPLAVASACAVPPVIGTVSASPSVLWPPNHELVSVTISYAVTSPLPATCSLSVSSNEPGSGESNVVDANHVLLRAERNGNGTGRIYTVAVNCTSAAGSANGATTVTVPHDQGK